MFLSERCELTSVLALQEKKNLMTARVSMLLKSRASLTCFRACFLLGLDKDLSAPLYTSFTQHISVLSDRITDTLSEHCLIQTETKASYDEGKQSLVCVKDCHSEDKQCW